MTHQKTESVGRRAVENLAMGGLIAAARIALVRAGVQEVVSRSEQVGRALRWLSPIAENRDTLTRARALAYRWSDVIPGATCLHRAIATRVWLAGFRVDSKVVLGFRKRAEFAGHAWLEVYLDDAATLLFVEDRDGYQVAIRG